MFIRRRQGWEIPESQVTPEGAQMPRRALLGSGAALGLAATGASSAHAWGLFGGSSSSSASPLVLKPLTAARNAHYDPGRALTAEKEATTYNNYYEFGLSKSVYDAAAALKVDPWSVEIAGMVQTPRKISYEDLMKQVKLEERVYRHRCVEAWAMTVPWIGFPLADLVKLAEPLGSATYVKFTTLADPKTMPGLHQAWYPWPYTEGLTMQEATNELAFLSVGLYGKTLPPQNGAPIRLNVPWKYGFKSAKSIVKVEFTDKQPLTFWQQLQDSEYGFWANVNPEVPHPRWSQAEERLIGTGTVAPTKIWNGYGEFVAAMYADKTKERLFV
jgi:methionine sulfoxide reductase catalytic subunit